MYLNIGRDDDDDYDDGESNNEDYYKKSIYTPSFPPTYFEKVK